jgi:hypothetical protein
LRFRGEDGDEEVRLRVAGADKLRMEREGVREEEGESDSASIGVEDC